MGRSVSYPPGAVVVFDTFDGKDWLDWKDFTNAFAWDVQTLFPQVYNYDHWLGREDHVLMANDHAYFGVSEYCGLVSLWMVVRDDAERPGLAEAWVRRAAPKFERSFGTLRKVGVFSNGGGVYEPKDPARPLTDNLDTDQGHLVIDGLLTDG